MARITAWYKRVSRQNQSEDSEGTEKWRDELGNYIQPSTIISQMDTEQPLTRRGVTADVIDQKLDRQEVMPNDIQAMWRAMGEPARDRRGYRFIQLPELHLRRRLTTASNEPEVWKANLCGQLLVVKIYQRSHAGMFLKDLEILKGVRHQNLPQLFGYSPPQDVEPHLVIRGDIRTAESIQKSLESLEGYTFAVKLTSELISAQIYLKEKKLNWGGDYKDLTVNEFNELSLDISSKCVRSYQAALQSDALILIDKIARQAVYKPCDTAPPSSRDSRPVVKATSHLLDLLLSDAQAFNINQRDLLVNLIVPGYLYDTGYHAVDDWYKRLVRNSVTTK